MFVYSSSPTHLFILTLSIRGTPTKLLRHFISIEHSLSFSQHFSYPMPLLRTTPSVQLLLHMHRHFLAFIPSPLLLSILFSAPHALYPSLILCTTSLSHMKETRSNLSSSTSLSDKGNRNLYYIKLHHMYYKCRKICTTSTDVQLMYI